MVHCRQKKNNLHAGFPSDIEEAVHHAVRQIHRKAGQSEQLGQTVKGRKTEHICLLLRSGGRTGHHHLRLQDSNNHAGRDHYREEKHRPEEGVSHILAAEHHGNQQAENHDNRHLIEHLQKGVGQIRQEFGIHGKHVDEVIQSDKGEFRGAAQHGHLAEGVYAGLNHRHKEKIDRADEPRENKQPAPALVALLRHSVFRQTNRRTVFLLFQTVPPFVTRKDSAASSTPSAETASLLKFTRTTVPSDQVVRETPFSSFSWRTMV